MSLTGIGEENIASFANVISRREINSGKLAAGVIEDDKAVAAAVFSEDEGVVFIDYLYVAPEYRRRGIAGRLLREALPAFGPGPVQAAFTDDQEGLYPFFDKMGYYLIRDTGIFSAPIAALRERCAASSLFSRPGREEIRYIRDMDRIEKDILFRRIRQEGLGVDGIDGKGISFAVTDKDGKTPKAALFCKKMGDTLIIDLLVNFSGKTLTIVELFRELLKVTDMPEFDHCRLVFLPAAQSVLTMAEELAGDALEKEGDMIYMCGRIKEDR